MQGTPDSLDGPDDKRRTEVSSEGGEDLRLGPGDVDRRLPVAPNSSRPRGSRLPVVTPKSRPLG